MTQLFANNITGVLTSGVSNSDTSVTLNDASLMPSPTGSDYFLLTLYGLNSNGQENAWEILKVTARSSNVLTVVRGQEGTTAVSWGASSTCQMRATGGAFSAKEDAANKDATGGYAGLTLFKLNLKNPANTITSWFTTAATAARTWTMPDKEGTVAMLSDITGTNSGTNTGDNATNTQYSGLVSNATHTGDATGSTALTVVKINGTSLAGLATGILKNTTTTGVPSIAAAGTDYQAPLVSATNIKTINGSSVLGSGDLSISGGAAASSVFISQNYGGF